jgi:hypothetical protein
MLKLSLITLASLTVKEVSPTMMTVKAYIQPSLEIEFTWRPNNTNTPAKEIKVEKIPQVTCQQESLHSIGDSTVQSTRYTYII